MKSIKLLICCVTLSLMIIAGCSQSDRDSTTSFEPQYIGGYPTKETAEAMFDEYDYQAAVQFYVWGYAYLNTLGMSKGYELMGGNERSMYIFDKLIQPQHVVMTANTNVIYNWSRLIDAGKGPVVVEAPAGSRGSIYDAGSRGVTDTGDIGPDQGKGGKYLVLSPDDRSSVPGGYHVVRLKYSNLFTVIIRTFPGDDGGVEAAVEKGKQIKWYYLSEATAPPPNIPVLIGDRAYSQEWPRDEKAFAWYSEIFNMDKVPASGLAHMGNMRRLGIEKGKPFAPDARAKKILERAAKTAEAMVLSMAYRNRQGRKIYPDRQYESITTNVSPSFFPGPFEEVEQRAGGWHQLVSNVSRYARPDKPGTGAFYMNTYRDKDGNQLLGQNTYRLRMPVEVPVTQFWQIPVYDVATRALINTDQKRGTLSGSDQLRKNADGSIDLYFGPEAPAGYESNWIKTIPGKGWFILPRLYGPLTPIWDRSWKLDDSVYY